MVQVDVTHVGENCMKENVGCVILTKILTNLAALYIKIIFFTILKIIKFIT
jgi:hypothetical protein